MSDKGNGGKVAVGAFLGLVGGFVAGLLFAPQSGKETREDIKNAANKVVDKVQKETDKLLDEAKKLAGTLSDKAQEEMKVLEKKVVEARDKVRKAAADTAAKKDDANLQAALDDAQSAFENLKTFIKNARS